MKPGFSIPQQTPQIPRILGRSSTQPRMRARYFAAASALFNRAFRRLAALR